MGYVINENWSYGKSFKSLSHRQISRTSRSCQQSHLIPGVQQLAGSELSFHAEQSHRSRIESVFGFKKHKIARFPFQFLQTYLEVLIHHGYTHKSNFNCLILEMGAPDLWQVGLLCKEAHPGAPFGDENPGFHWNNNPQARKFTWFINAFQTFFQWLSTTDMDWSGSSSFSQQKPGNRALPPWWTKDPRSSGRWFLGSHCLDLGMCKWPKQWE